MNNYLDIVLMTINQIKKILHKKKRSHTDIDRGNALFEELKKKKKIIKTKIETDGDTSVETKKEITLFFQKFDDYYFRLNNKTTIPYIVRDCLKARGVANCKQCSRFMQNGCRLLLNNTYTVDEMCNIWRKI